MTFQIGGTQVVGSSREITLGTATPGSSATGMIRYNSSLTQFEVYDGTAWVAIVTTVAATPTLYSWGGNNSGQLGIGSVQLYPNGRSSPVSVLGTFVDWLSVSGGLYMSAGIRANGTAWTWGSNNSGRLGDFTTTYKSSPVSVVGGFTDWVQIQAKSWCAGLRANGTIWTWGFNANWSLGTNDQIARSSPTSVVGGITNWTELATGTYHALALRADGSLWSWGPGGNGALGNNSVITSGSPVSVVGNFTDWIDIEAGGSSSFGIRGNGTAWAWGYNSYGRLGIGNTANRSSPTSIVGGFTDWTQISSGFSSSTGLRANGTLWSWGQNFKGNLGINLTGTGLPNTGNRSSPTSVVGGISDWVKISRGSDFAVALRANGTLWSWGYNVYGQLGTSDKIDRSSPTSIVGGFTDWANIGSGGVSGFAIRAI